MPTTRIAYGCMNIGGSWDNSGVTAEHRRKGFAAIEAALGTGINCFDHADIYCRGKSERVFGEYLRAHPGLRERIVIQSKCGIRFSGDPHASSPGRYDFSWEHLVGSVEGILTRLGIQRLDLLLLHRPDCLVEPEEVARAFDALEASGKVRAFGVSNHAGSQLDLLRSRVRQPLVVNQVALGLWNVALIDEGITANRSDATYGNAAGTLDYCRLHGVRIQAYSPLGGGRFFRTGLPADDPARVAWQAVRTMAAAKNVQPEAVALAWLLRHPAGIQPVIGSTDPVRIAAAAAGDGVDLSREEWYALFTVARGGPVP